MYFLGHFVRAPPHSRSKSGRDSLIGGPATFDSLGAPPAPPFPTGLSEIMQRSGSASPDPAISQGAADPEWLQRVAAREKQQAEWAKDEKPHWEAARDAAVVDAPPAEGGGRRGATSERGRTGCRGGTRCP